jgi:predicted  nucleic acid-binding Zn-ribbon protein
MNRRKKMDNKQDAKIQAVKKAFEAYEKAVAAAREVIKDGPIRGLGTCMMEVHYSNSDPNRVESYKCTECGITLSTGWVSSVEGWKFCPGCGAEIMKFARDSKPGSEQSAHIEVIFREDPTEEPKTLELTIQEEPAGILRPTVTAESATKQGKAKSASKNQPKTLTPEENRAQSGKTFDKAIRRGR